MDVLEVIRAANSQPYSHVHQPGLGVGGHCIPVYPHFLLSRAPEMELVEVSRRVNDGQVALAIRALADELGGLGDVPVLVLGLTYREGVKELAYTRALPLIAGLAAEGARVSAWDPLLSSDETERCGAQSLDLGLDERRTRDRHPDRRPGVPPTRHGLVPRARGDPRRPEQPAGGRVPGHDPGARGGRSGPRGPAPRVEPRPDRSVAGADTRATSAPSGSTSLRPARPGASWTR